MIVENQVNQHLQVIRGDASIDVPSIPLARPISTGYEPATLTSAPPFSLVEAERDRKVTPQGLTQAQDTWSLSPQSHSDAPESSLKPFSTPGSLVSPSVELFLSQDLNHERLRLGLPSNRDSVSFDCNHCGKSFTGASYLKYYIQFLLF